tara:strand:+ start:508 stop:636 length:129 start_codon:yes stop_codon:yes gene_type:complete
MKLVYKFLLWRLKRMMDKATDLDAKIGKLAEIIQIMEDAPDE